MGQNKIQFSKNLRQLLGEKNLSLHQLSKLNNINKSSLHNYLNGVVPRGLESAVKLALFFDVSLDELVFGRSQKGVDPNEIKLHSLEGVIRDYN